MRRKGDPRAVRYSRLRGLCLASALAAVFGVAPSAFAHDDSASDGLIDGGGRAKTDCICRFQTGLELNYPVSDPLSGHRARDARELSCADGDLACDGDREVDGSCTFHIGLCLADDGDLQDCTPAGVPPGGVAVKNKGSSPK